MLHTEAIPIFEDNYIWLIRHPEKSLALLVDPGEGQAALAALTVKKLSLAAILITHKHWDHVNGITSLLTHFQVNIYGNANENIAQVTHAVGDQDEIRLGEGWPAIKVISVPGHTKGHVAYYCAGALFCGDTLFGAGCGRLFEGTADEMATSLDKITALPDDTLIYCAHEYTLKNLSFAKQVEPSNPAIAERIITTEALRAKHEPSIPSTLALEKQTNPFLRCDQEEIQQNVSGFAKKALSHRLEVFRYLREWRNQW